MRTIYLLRHCETEGSFQRCIGVTDVPLSAEGVKHAQRLGAYFADKKIAAVFCSSTERAVRTARAVAGEGTAVTKREDLHEIDMGDWDGLSFAEIRARFPEEYRQRGLALADFTPPHGESFAACRERAKKAMRRIACGTEGDIVVVAHAGFNRAFLCDLCRVNLQDLFTIPQPYGCVNILVMQNGAFWPREVDAPAKRGEEPLHARRAEDAE